MPRRKPLPPPEPPKRRRRRGTGSIVLLADGTIRARLPAPARTAREFRPGHLAEAEAWIESYLHPAAPTDAGPIVTTVGEWAGYWHQTYVAPIRPPNTVKWYLYALQQLASLYALPLPDLRASALQGVVGVLSQRIGAATVQSIAGVWRRCLAAAVDDELLTRNPARRLTVPPAPKKPPARHVTADEIAIIWPAIAGERFEIAYALALGCGLRIGEILGLPVKHVDPVNRRVWVQDQFTNGHWRPLPKGRNPHWAPMPDRVADIMARHLETLPAGYTLVMQSPWMGKVAKREKRPRPWARNTVANDLHAIVKRLRLDPLTPHAGRHGLVTALLDGGVSPAVIAQRVGHADAATTMKFYPHVSREGAIRADQVTDQYLNGGPSGAVEGTQTDGMDEIGATG